MKDQNFPCKKDPQIIILSFFGTGFSPKMPGTMGSLATIPLLYLLSYFSVPVIFLIPFSVLLFVISSYMAEQQQKIHHIQDPSWIVIDEVIGMLVTWSFWPENSIVALLSIFMTFRFFDILKPWPISLVDKKMKNGVGVMLDDVIAGLFAGLTCLVIKNFVPNFF